MTRIVFEIAKLLLGSSLIAFGVIGLWGIATGQLSTVGLIILIPQIACGLYTAYPTQQSRSAL